MDKQHYNIIIAVLASHNNIYDEIIINYWNKLITIINSEYKNIKIYLLFGNNYRGCIIPKNNIFISNIKDSLIPGCLIKTIDFFQYINSKYSYKYVFRTNISSFLIIENMISLSNNLKSTNLYAGSIVKNHGCLDVINNFSSGAGFWISKDVLIYILNNREKLNFKKPDDVAIGIILKNINIINTPRLDIVPSKSWVSGMDRFEINDYPNKKTLSNIYDKILKNKYYHIRVKVNFDRHIDIMIMNYLMNKIYNI